MTHQPTTPDSDVPETLKENKETKEIQEQMAEEALKNQIPKSDIVLAAVGYIGFLCILPLVMRRESEYCQHHAHQALILAIAVYFLDSVQILPAWLVSVYLFLKYAVILFSVYQALKGKKHKLPFVYGISQKFQVTIK